MMYKKAEVETMTAAMMAAVTKLREIVEDSLQDDHDYDITIDDTVLTVTYHYYDGTASSRVDLSCDELKIPDDIHDACTRAMAAAMDAAS